MLGSSIGIKKVSDENRMRYEGGQYYLKSEEELRQLFPQQTEAFENTVKISEKFNKQYNINLTTKDVFQPNDFKTKRFNINNYWKYSSICSTCLLIISLVTLFVVAPISVKGWIFNLILLALGPLPTIKSSA